MNTSGRHFLQIPGPTNVPDRILKAIEQPTIDHRGPAFKMLCREVLEGLIEVTNTITGESTEVENGETAISTSEGSLEVHETTTDDLAGFEDADVEIPTQELRFEVEDEDGNIKEIIIRFQ